MITKAQIQYFKQKIASLSEQELSAMAEQENKRVEKDHEDFKFHLKRGECSLCGNLFTHFSVKKPCIHWLLGPYGPKGFKKNKHFSLIYNKFAFHHIDAYLRWMANNEKPFININDLKEERSQNKKIEHTIKYKNIEWSFSCTDSDFAGHVDTFKGDIPHYHFQMKINDKVVISFNKYHLPFHDEDFFNFSVKNEEFGEKISYREGYATGFGGAVHSLGEAELLKTLKYSENEEDAHFHMQTIMQSKPGETIKGEDIIELIKEREQIGKPIALLADKLLNVDKTVFLSPGKAVPEISKRTPRKRNSPKND